MRTLPPRILASLVAIVCLTVSAWTADRVWQKGTWRDIQIKRPKVVFGVSSNTPMSGAPRGAAAAQETRTYVIETDTLRLELRENVTVDTPRLDVLVGDPVEFALEKKTVWIKDQGGRERKLSLVKQTTRKEKE